MTARLATPTARLALVFIDTQVEGTCSGRYGFIVMVTRMEEPGMGEVTDDGTARAKFHIKYDCILMIWLNCPITHSNHPIRRHCKVNNFSPFKWRFDNVYWFNIPSFFYFLKFFFDKSFYFSFIKISCND